MNLQAGGRNHSPEPFSDLLARLEAIRGELNDVTASVLRTAGIRVAPEGMTIERALSVLGALDVSGSAEVSGDLDVTGSAAFSGDTTIGGNAAITGTLSLPAGIIDNEALANPVYPDASGNGVVNFALPGAWTELVSCTLTVPPGFTWMTFSAYGSITARNDTGAIQYLISYPRRQINGTGSIYSGIPAQATLANGYWGTVVSPYSWSESVTPGAVHRFWLEGFGGGGFSAHPDHDARVHVVATFSR